jgi:phage shock protein E
MAPDPEAVRKTHLTGGRMIRSILALSLSLALVAGCAPTTQAGAAPTAADVVYLDVRTNEEVAEGKLAGAVHIPIAELEARIAELQAYDDQEIVVYCRSGNRSARAVSLLQERGFDNVTDGGAMSAIAATGVELVDP